MNPTARGYDTATRSKAVSNRPPSHPPSHPTAIKLGKGLTRNVAIKGSNNLRAFRWGADADHPDVIFLHHALSCANKASESGRTIESYESYPKGNVRGAVACSFAKTRARQDAGHSLRDAGAPRGEITRQPSCPTGSLGTAIPGASAHT